MNIFHFNTNIVFNWADFFQRVLSFMD